MFPVATLGPPSRVDRMLRPAGNWLLSVAVIGLVAAWSWSASARVRASELLIWSGAASIAIVVVATYLPQQGAWYTAAAVAVAVLDAVAPPLQERARRCSS